MSFDLFAQEKQILARLLPLPGNTPLVDTFTQVDVTDDGAAPVTAQVSFMEFSPEGQAGRSARYYARWSFNLYIDTLRVSEEQKAAAMALFSAAMGALIGWEASPGCSVQSVEGQESGFDGRVIRCSFGFILRVYV